MKKFIYQVHTYEWEDTIPFGEGWRTAKAMATKLHEPVFRLVINDDKVQQQVFYKGGLFNSVEFMREDNVKVF